MGRDESCPKCCSLDVAVWGFDEENVSYQCSECRYKWVRSRRLLSEVPVSSRSATGYRESRKRKFEASSLKEFCQKCTGLKNKKVLVWPYLPRTVVEGDSDFGLIVESENVKYEVGLSRILFFDQYFYFWIDRSGQVIRSKIPCFDFSVVRQKIGMFEDFARGLSRYLTENGCAADAKEVQHLSRTPERILVGEDLKIVLHILGRYC